MRNVKLTIEYDGTNYNGWQSQKNGTAIQDRIEDAIYKITNEKTKIFGAGRTDAGVHAFGQVANFFTESLIPAEKFPFALNAILPKDIVITKTEEVDYSFHARFSAKEKRYEYLIFNSVYPSAIFNNKVWHVFYELDMDSMKQAASFFIGTHDFTSFAASDPKDKKRTNITITPFNNNIRTINELNITKVNNIIKVSVKADGFLYKMVRIIVGTLVDVGRGKMESGTINKIIMACDRRSAGRTAPPYGLYLMEVSY